MPIDLFTPQVDPSRQHEVFRRLMEDQYAPERAVLAQWAEGFEDRDGKFVQEFQMTFESGLWELYLNAMLGTLGLSPDMSFASPDFVVTQPTSLSIEAAIAAPAQGGKPAYNYRPEDIPDDFGDFNVQATLRICNSFDYKVRRYRERYRQVPQVAREPLHEPQATAVAAGGVS